MFIVRGIMMFSGITDTAMQSDMKLIAGLEILKTG